jgi:NAD(P)-dependent dehydrogenase (short-subunit alcohol dehydrogenase family)
LDIIGYKMLNSKILQKKIALITGASRGIGAAIAKRFAEEGAHVILLARSVKGLAEIYDYAVSVGSKATIVQVDVSDGDKIDELGYSILQRFGRLDILVGNAAQLGNLSPLAHTDAVHFNKLLAINLTANFRLIRSMDPLLRLSPHGRAIFVTADAAHSCRAYWGAYSVSKAGLEGLVKTYAAEVASTNIKVNLVDPGTVATKMLANCMPGIELAGLTNPEEITDIFVTLASEACASNGLLHQINTKIKVAI